MIGRSKTDDDIYHPVESEKEELDKPKYLATVGALLYLMTNTWPDISFAVSVLARHSQRPTTRHWQGIKHLLKYIQGIEDLGLYFCRRQNDIIGYADSRLKLDSTTGKSQLCYIFIKNEASIY